MGEKYERQIRKEKPDYLRMPVSVEIDGKKEQIWVKYQIREKEFEGKCIECGKTEAANIQAASHIEVESSNSAIGVLATEKIKELVQKVEEEMFVCKDHYTQEFKDNRPKLYVEVLKRVQGELGIVAPDDQEARIKNEIHMD